MEDTSTVFLITGKVHTLTGEKGKNDSCGNGTLYSPTFSFMSTARPSQLKTGYKRWSLFLLLYFQDSHGARVQIKRNSTTSGYPKKTFS